MNLATFLLAVSLVGNAVLAMVYWRRMDTTSPAGAGAASTAVAAAPAPPSDSVAAVLRDHPEFAAAVKSGDHKQIREALVRAGFPDTYVRDMVTFDLNNSVTPEKLELLRFQAEKPFWKGRISDEGIALEKSLGELDLKNTALAKDVFGGKVPPHPLEAQNQQRRYRFLPEEKAAQVARIDSDYAEIQAAARQGGGAAARDKLQLLQQEKRADLAKVLTPQELELYDLTLSSTAESMRRSLALFQPTEEEFRQLFQIRREFEEKHSGLLGRPDQAEARQRLADQQAVNDRARALLGEQRFTEYQRAQDFGFRAASEIARHFKLPETTAAETYNLQQSVMKQAQDITRAAGGDPALLASQIGALVETTNRQLSQLLGPQGADAYKKSAGMWLASLQRGAATAPPGR